MCAGAIQVELDGPLHVAQHGVLTLIGIRKSLAVEGKIAGLLDVRRDRIEQPQAIVGAVLILTRRTLGTRVMRELLDHRHRAAGGDLAGDHQLQAPYGLRGDGVHHAEHVLHRVPEAQAIPLAGIDQAGGARPRVGHQAVERAPHVQHAVEFGVWRVHVEPGNARMPVTLEAGQLLGDLLRIAEFLSGPTAFFARRADAHQHQKLARLTRLQADSALQHAATVIAGGKGIGALSPLDHRGPGITSVSAEERRAVRVVPGDFCTHQGQKSVPPLIRFLEVSGHEGKVDVGAVIDDAAIHSHLDDVLGVLQIDQVVVGTPVSRIFHVGKAAEAARLAARVGQPDAPTLEASAERNKVRGLRLYACILGRDDGVRAPVTAFRFVTIQRLAHRLPRSGPVVAAIVIVQVDIAPRLVQRDGIEPEPREAPLRRRLIEAISSGIVGDDGAILGAAQVITPGLGSIGTSNYIFLINIVKISELHVSAPGSLV